MLNINAVEVRELEVVRGGNRVLSGLSVDIEAGKITGLLGPSGCGKTTLIRCLAGIQIVKSGTVSVLGGPAGTAEAHQRVGYVSQASSVYPDLTVHQNLKYFSALSGNDNEAIRNAIDLVGLQNREHTLTGSLSGGQRTRVSLAVALMADPDLYLLDEPTVGLDPVLRRDLWKLFRELTARGKTLLVSSHVMDEAGRCDQVLLMREGNLIAQSSPDELRQKAGTNDLEQAFLALAERGAA